MPELVSRHFRAETLVAPHKTTWNLAWISTRFHRDPTNHHLTCTTCVTSDIFGVEWWDERLKTLPRSNSRVNFPHEISHKCVIMDRGEYSDEWVSKSKHALAKFGCLRVWSTKHKQNTRAASRNAWMRRLGVNHSIFQLVIFFRWTSPKTSSQITLINLRKVKPSWEPTNTVFDGRKAKLEKTIPKRSKNRNTDTKSQ